MVFALDAIQEPLSLFEPVYHDGGDPIYVMDQIGDEKNSDQQWLESISINEALSRLGEREKKIIDLRFFSGKTQMEVAAEVGISYSERKSYIFTRNKDAYKGLYDFIAEVEVMLAV